MEPDPDPLFPNVDPRILINYFQCASWDLDTDPDPRPNEIDPQRCSARLPYPSKYMITVQKLVLHLIDICSLVQKTQTRFQAGRSRFLTGRSRFLSGRPRFLAGKSRFAAERS